MLRNLNYSPVAGKRILGTPRVGVLGSAIPAESYIYPSLDLPGDATKFYRGWVVTRPAQGTLTTYENGAYEYDSTGAVGQQSFTVQLYEQGATLGSPITVTIDVVSNATVSSVTVTPDPASIAGNATQQFAAAVAGTNSPPTTVTWTYSPTTPGASISGTGLFTAPPATGAVQTFTITATSTFDGTKSDSATLTVQAAAFSQYPAPSDVRSGVQYGASGEFTGTLAGGGGGALTVVISGGVGVSSDGSLVVGTIH